MLDKLLAAHTPFDSSEADDIAATRDLIRNYSDSYYRTHFNPGHVTGSGLLLSHDRQRVLLNHHKFLNIWIGFGGHADGERDIFSVCRREIIEESGIENIEPLTESIVDVGVHSVPDNPKKGEPAHKHFDIRYIFRVKNPANENFIMSDESVNMRWCGFDEAMALVNANDKICRLLKKWKLLAR